MDCGNMLLLGPIAILGGIVLRLGVDHGVVEEIINVEVLLVI